MRGAEHSGILARRKPFLLGARSPPRRSAPGLVILPRRIRSGCGEPVAQRRKAREGPQVRIPQGLDLTRTGIRTEMTVADWQRLGVAPRHGSLPSGNMPASLILPQGHRGPAFMVFPNFRVLFDWNQSFTYVVTAAYFATRLDGAPVYDAGNPQPGLDRDQMRELQRRLQARGFNTGGVTGILGANTRAAVQDVQAQLGLPADGWPTPELLRRL